MCRDEIDRAIDRLETSITGYWVVTGVVATLSLCVFAVSNMPGNLFFVIRDKTLGNLLGCFLTAITGLPYKEIAARKERIVLLETVKRDYASSGLAPATALDERCERVLEKVLGN